MFVIFFTKLANDTEVIAINYLASPSDTLPDAEVAENPHKQQCSGEFPTNAADFIDST